MPLANSSLGTPVHAQFGKALPQFRRAYITIEVHGGGKLPDGQPDVDDWGPVPTLQNMMCTLADRAAWERRGRELTEARSTHVAGLDQYLPQITISHRASISHVNGRVAEVYNITAVKHDSQQVLSWLELEIETH